MHTEEGVFTQPGPDGLFGRGGPPGDATAPSIDSDGVNLRETLVVAYPSPGHMRVARAVRHPTSGRVEFQEEYRAPTPEELAILKNKGVEAGPGSMMVSGLGATDAATSSTVPGTGFSGAVSQWPWGKLACAVVAGAAGFWAVNRWVVPMFEAAEDEEYGYED